MINVWWLLTTLKLYVVNALISRQNCEFPILIIFTWVQAPNLSGFARQIKSVRYPFRQRASRMSATDPEIDPDADSGGPPRYRRRLSDKVLIAFHQACDQHDLEVAEQLLGVLDLTMSRRPLARGGNQRRAGEGLVAAYERLWHLKHPPGLDLRSEAQPAVKVPSTGRAGNGQTNLPADPRGSTTQPRRWWGSEAPTR
jgi:hypothetical protein